MARAHPGFRRRDRVGRNGGRSRRDLWDNKIRYVGVGAMVVGGLASIVAARRGLVEAIRHLTGSAGGGGLEHERDLPRA